MFTKREHRENNKDLKSVRRNVLKSETGVRKTGDDIRRLIDYLD